MKGETKASALLFPHILAADLKKEERERIMAAINMDDQAIIQMHFSDMLALNLVPEDEDYDSEES